MPKIYIHERLGSQRLVFFCVACGAEHSVTVQKPQGDPGQVWDWNGSDEEPTLAQPLVITVDNSSGVGSGVCKSTITDGQIKFDPQSTHAMAGETIPLPDF